MALDNCAVALPELEQSSVLRRRPNVFPLWLKVLAVGLAFYAGAEIGRFLSPENSSIVIFWLPGGIYVAALLLNPVRTWPWFILMALLLNLAFGLPLGRSVLVTVCYFCANTLHAVLGASLVRHFVAPRLTLRTLRELLGFLGLVCIVSAMLGALVAATVLTTMGLSHSFFQSWRIWWGSNALAVLAFSPFILIWASPAPSMLQYLRQRKRVCEAAVCFLSFLAATWWFLLHGGGVTVPNKAPMVLFLLWAGLRLGVRSIAAFNFLLALLFTFLTVHFHTGLTPADLASGDYVFLLQIQLTVASLIGLIPALVLQEHDVTETALRASEERYRALSTRLRSLREEERSHLAREIHDHLGQLLTALSLDLRLIERRAAHVPDVALRDFLAAKAKAAQALADETITSVQKIASELRPAILDRLGLEAAIEAEAQLFRERTGVACHCTVPEIPVAASQEEATAIFRIFQEILTNVSRHAHAKNLTVNLSQQNEILQLEVEDDGIGIKPEDISNPASLGILGMQERAAILGGGITLDSGPSNGTRVKARVVLQGKVGPLL
jgi:signal transduction histidine kinase